MSVIPEGFGEATIFIEGGPSDPINIVWGYEVATLTSEPNENAQNNLEAFALGNNPWSELSGTLRVTRCEVRETEGGNLRTGEYAATVLTGFPANAAFPPNNAILVRKVTAQGGREHTGRMYMPGVDETGADNTGLLTTAYVAALQASVNGMLGDMSTNDIPMYVLHQNPLTPPTLVTSLVVQSRTATQRRRLR